MVHNLRQDFLLLAVHDKHLAPNGMIVGSTARAPNDPSLGLEDLEPVWVCLLRGDVQQPAHRTEKRRAAVKNAVHDRIPLHSGELVR